MASLSEVEGIGSAYAEKLESAGIGSTDALLERGSNPKGRQQIADATGISDKLILRWVNHVDLFRVKGVAGEYAELLEAAGVDTVPELAQRNPENLHAALAAANEPKKLVRQVPALSQVAGWIEEAKGLPRVVTY
jgi:predicted RecB family nuclease